MTFSHSEALSSNCYLSLTPIFNVMIVIKNISFSKRVVVNFISSKFICISILNENRKRLNNVQDGDM